MNPHPLPLDPTAVFRTARGKRGLMLAVGVLMVALGLGWFATSRLEPTPSPAQDKLTQARATLDRTTLDRTTLDHLDLSTFQRRGALLVGEVTTPAGVRLRLVLDANTHALVGLRVVETEAGPAR